MNVGHFFRHPLLLKIQSKKIPRNQCRSKKTIFMSESQYEKFLEINVGQKFDIHVRTSV